MRARSFWLRFLGLGLVACVTALACSSPEFTTSTATGGSAGSGAVPEAGEAGTPPGSGGTAGGTSGTGGTAGGGTTLCKEAADCDDMSPCTVDSCTGPGVCAHDPKCTGDQPLCCDGVCGECCSTADCFDGLECTDDVCFAGFCTNPPNDSCGADAYCGPTGCVARENCQTAADCDDTNPCTDDACDNGFCAHDLCPNGGSCCEGQGCGTCCIDAQCTTDNADPCTLSVCENRQCASVPLCAVGELCCPNGDRSTATCGTCCSATDCPDDGVNCTVAVCADGCQNQVQPGVCAMGQTCDPERGCIGGGGCMQASECQPPTDPCDTVRCDTGVCKYGEVDCSGGQKCCSSLLGMSTGPHCRDCCDNRDCPTSGGSGSLCCQEDGACHQCCADTDCVLGMTQASGGMPLPAGGPIVPGNCMVPVCLSDRTCGSKSLCTKEQQCCNGLCQPLGTGCILPI